MLRLKYTPNGLCWDKSRHFDPYALMEQELAKRNKHRHANAEMYSDIQKEKVLM